MWERLQRFWDTLVAWTRNEFVSYRNHVLAFLAAAVWAPDQYESKYSWYKYQPREFLWDHIVSKLEELEDRITSLLSWGFEPTNENKIAFRRNLQLILYLLASIFGALASIAIFTPGFIIGSVWNMLGHIISAIPIVGGWLASGFYAIRRATIRLYEKAATLVFLPFYYLYRAAWPLVRSAAEIIWRMLAQVLVPVKQELMEVWYNVNQTWWAQSIAMIVLGEDLYNAIDDFYEALGGDAYVLRQKASSEATWYGIPDPDIILGTGYRSRPFSEIGGS